MSGSEAATVSYLLNNVTQFLSDNYHLSADVRGKLVGLQGDLSALKSVMSDFSRYNYDGGDFLNTTVAEIRNILDEAQDAADAYMAVRKRGFISRAVEKVTGYPTGLRRVAKLTESVAARVKQIQDRNMLAYAALEHQAANRRNKKAIEAPKVEEEHVFGFDDAAKVVRALLTEGPEQLEVISIVGMLGLGKTTLAYKVYNAPIVGYENTIQSFVYVSQEYDKKKVFLKILSSFTEINDEVANWEETKLENHLRGELEGKKYLIVLDDVWNPKDWDNFKGAFPDNQMRSRVLLTTRNELVAKHANPGNPNSHYKLGFLKLDDCRKLLRWRVFKVDEEEDVPKGLLEYEINIAKKCNGLPLAVVVIAGVLVDQPDWVELWKEVEEKVENYTARGDLAGGVIDVMYKHLPNHLKHCFLYLGVFHEDFEIPLWKLVRLWIAEELIDVGVFNWEIMAEQYLEELVYRNLVVVGQRRSNGRIKTCRMHDMLREFCKRQALNENLFQEIKKGQSGSFLPKDLAFDQCHRLCINNADSLAYISETPSGKHVRSFLTFVKEEAPVEARHISSLLKNFNYLRVLEIQSLSFSRFPANLCSSLVNLKYVALSSNLSTLPSSLSALIYLQTLIVKTTCLTLEIKVNLWKMPHFRHLHTNATANVKVDETLEEAPNDSVQTLCFISPESCKEVFVRSPKIRKLGICGALNKFSEVHVGSSFLTRLWKLESLENLKLLNDGLNNSPFSLPSVKEFPKNLTKLTLMNTQLEWKEISTLGQLESLEVLKLKKYAFKGILWKTEKDGFLALKHLYIGRTDLVVWEASVEDFPKLQSLELNCCVQLQDIPNGLGMIPSLQSMVLHCTNTQVAYSAKKLHVLRLLHFKQAEFKLCVYPPDH